MAGRILALAERSLEEWESGRRNLDAIADSLRREAPAERPAVASLLFSYFRRKGFIDSLIDSRASKGKVKPQLKRILAVATAQALLQTGIAPESAANVAVDFTRELYGDPSARFVNAMLRAILRDRPAVPELAALPERLAARWRKNFGEAAASAAMNSLSRNPHLALRVRGEIPETELEALGCSKLQLPDWAKPFDFRECSKPDALFQSGLLEKGLVYVQDPATAFAASMAEGRLKGKVVDLCAAPGGKTVMLADLAGGKAEIYACDRSEVRLAIAVENFRRAGHSIKTFVADASGEPFPPESFDLVFADVPCSNTGVARRRPDAPWRFSMGSLEKISGLQVRILESAAKLVAPGGALIYSTCSVEPEEGQLQVEKFIARRPFLKIEKSGMILPCETHDGAFAALLVRV